MIIQFTLGVDLFDGLGELQKLLLNNNELILLDSNTFSSLINLRTLILYDNKLSDIKYKKKDFYKFSSKGPLEVLFDQTINQ